MNMFKIRSDAITVFWILAVFAAGFALGLAAGVIDSKNTIERLHKQIDDAYQLDASKKDINSTT